MPDRDDEALAKTVTLRLTEREWEAVQAARKAARVRSASHWMRLAILDALGKESGS